MPRKVFTLFIKNLSFLIVVFGLLFPNSIFAADSIEVEIPPNIVWHRGAKQNLNLCIQHHCLNQNVGYLSLSLLDHKKQNPVDGWFLNFFPNQYFTTIKNGKPCFDFKFEVPHTYSYDSVWMLLTLHLPAKTDSSLTLIRIINKD